MKVELTIEEIRRVVTMYVGAETIRYSDGLPLLWKIAYHNITGQADAIQMSDNKPKILLRPLASLTDEHAIDVAKIYGVNLSKWDEAKYGVLADRYRKSVIDEVKIYNDLPAKVHQYLISKSYSVPLWFGIDHPANGLDAIQCGIGVEKGVEVGR